MKRTKKHDEYLGHGQKVGCRKKVQILGNLTKSRTKSSTFSKTYILHFEVTFQISYFF